MSEIIRPSRRGFLTGLGAMLITAPAIVRATSLMPVKMMPAEEVLREIPLFGNIPPIDDMHAEMIKVVRRAFLPRIYLQIWNQSPLLHEFGLASAHE